jgi:hypothetical protein
MGLPTMKFPEQPDLAILTNLVTFFYFRDIVYALIGESFPLQAGLKTQLRQLGEIAPQLQPASLLIGMSYCGSSLKRAKTSSPGVKYASGSHVNDWAV